MDDVILEFKETGKTIMEVLHKVQEEEGFISYKNQIAISKIYDEPLSKVYGIVTFYSDFKLEKKGKHVITVCLGTACYVKGANELVEEIKKLLNISEGETTEDGLFTLAGARCLGCCSLAPVMDIDGKIYGKVNKKDVKDLLDGFRK